MIDKTAMMMTMTRYAKKTLMLMMINDDGTDDYDQDADDNWYIWVTELHLGCRSQLANTDQ